MRKEVGITQSHRFGIWQSQYDLDLEKWSDAEFIAKVDTSHIASNKSITILSRPLTEESGQMLVWTQSVDKLQVLLASRYFSEVGTWGAPQQLSCRKLGDVYLMSLNVRRESLLTVKWCHPLVETTIPYAVKAKNFLIRLDSIVRRFPFPIKHTN